MSTQIKAQARVQFDRWARTYDRSLLNELVFFPSIRACQEELHRWQRQRGYGPYALLDVGCGTGSLVTLLAGDAHATRLVGLDYSPVMIEKLSRKIAADGLGGRVGAVVADSERLPFADGTFDLITCCNSFHHYPHQGAVLRGFHRVLKPGGQLILIDGFRDNVIGWVIFDVVVTGIERDVHHASWRRTRDLLREAGFSAIRQRKLNVLAPLLVSLAGKA